MSRPAVLDPRAALRTLPKAIGVALAMGGGLWLLGLHEVRHAFLVPGLALQRVTTREPTAAETQVALRAVAAVLQHELP